MEKETFLDRMTVREIMDANKKRKSLEEFEDIYNPMRVYGRLKRLMPKEEARELSSWYEDIFYKQAIDRIKR